MPNIRTNFDLSHQLRNCLDKGIAFIDKRIKAERSGGWWKELTTSMKILQHMVTSFFTAKEVGLQSISSGITNSLRGRVALLLKLLIYPKA